MFAIVYNVQFALLFLVIALAVYFLVAVIFFIADKKETYRDTEQLGFWLGFAGAVILVLFAILSFSALDKENDIRRNACKEKNLSVLTANPENSVNDINYILSKICK